MQTTQRKREWDIWWPHQAQKELGHPGPHLFISDEFIGCVLQTHPYPGGQHKGGKRGQRCLPDSLSLLSKAIGMTHSTRAPLAPATMVLGTISTIIVTQSHLETELTFGCDQHTEKEQGREDFICREIKRWHRDLGSQLDFKQLSSLGKTNVTVSYAFYHYSSSWGFLGFQFGTGFGSHAQ